MCKNLTYIKKIIKIKQMTKLRKPTKHQLKQMILEWEIQIKDLVAEREKKYGTIRVPNVLKIFNY